MEVLEESPQSVSFKVTKCPIYEAAQMMGVDAETIENLCRSGPIRFMDAMTKQLNPNFHLSRQGHLALHFLLLPVLISTYKGFFVVLKPLISMKSHMMKAC